uniref:DNA-directed RNA polymerase III subunit RPC3 n=1 Tax=Moina brachiata TaxID=675436 RepID=A0A4Y7NK57_9CRUS|nr:EOG090X04YD [Moina brachiata]SVE92974.1 EOG090X04YD [Moina brachiata]
MTQYTLCHFSQVKRALAVMIQHNLVQFTSSERNPNLAEYSVIPQHIYKLIRFPKYLYVIKLLFGIPEEVLLEVLLNQGQASASSIIFQAANRLKEANEDDNQALSPSSLHGHFLKLAKDEYIVRCPNVKTGQENTRVPQFVVEEKKEDNFKVPDIDLQHLGVKFRENAPHLGEHSDSKIVWRVNHERFDIVLRNLLLIDAAENRIDTTAAELYHILLKQWHEISPANAPQTNMLSYNVIKDAVRRNDSSSPTLLEHFDEYMRVLFEDSADFVTVAGDAGGGQFVLNYVSVFENLAAATLDSIVLEKFGSKALRIFRLIRMQKFMEQDPLQNLSMISAKEAKYFSYRLLEHNFLQIKELRKSTSNMAPVKSFILFYVDLPEVARTALALTYKGLFNAMIRRDHEITSNKRLLDKQERVESIIRSMRAQEAPEEEIAYVADAMSSSEKVTLTRIETMSDNVILAQTQVDETVLILETYLSYAVAK